MEKDIHEQLQSYIDNTMEERMRIDFETKLKNSPELQRDYQLLIDIEKELSNKDVQDFKSKLKKVVQKPALEKKVRPAKQVQLRRRILGIAATLLLCVVTWWWFNSNVNNYTALADDFFISYPAPKVRSENTTYELLFKTYENENYKYSSFTLEEYGIANEDNEVLIYSAISYLALGDNDKTLDILNKITPTSAQANKFNYFISLAYLGKNDKSSALNALRKVNEADAFLFKNAKALIERLDS